MAQYFKEVLGDKLFTASTSDCLPAPDALRKCIILISKKLPRGIGNDAWSYAAAAEIAETGARVLANRSVDRRDHGAPTELEEPATPPGLGHGNFLFSRGAVDKSLSDCVFVNEVQFRGFISVKENSMSNGLYVRSID